MKENDVGVRHEGGLGLGGIKVGGMKVLSVFSPGVGFAHWPLIP